MIALVGVALGAPIDLNAGGVDEIAALPGIGPAKAAALLEWRGIHGPCTSVEELAAIPGFGRATIELLRSRATCSSVEAAPAPSEAPSSPPAARVVVVDVNAADPEALALLPGISEVEAQAIVAERERGGRFASCADLVRVPGIGPATVANLGPTCVAR